MYVEDVAAGIVGALDRGRIGESYVLGGENTRLRDAMRVAARIGGKGMPRLEVPTALLRIGSKAPAVLARAAGLPDDLGEVVRSSLGRHLLGVVGQGRDGARLSAARPGERPARHLR